MAVGALWARHVSSGRLPQLCPVNFSGGFQQKRAFLLSSSEVFSWGGKEMRLGITKNFKHWGSPLFLCQSNEQDFGAQSQEM